MFRSLSALSAAVLLAFVSGRAEDNQFVRPRLGYVFDASTRQIRPLIGTPGAALVAGGVPLDLALDRALVSSANSFAIVTAPDSANVKVVRLLESGPIVTPIPNSFDTYDLGSLSRSGKAAILYQAACRCVQVLSGLPDDPQIARNLTLPPDESVVQALAIADDSSRFAIARRTGDSGEITIYAQETSSEYPVSADALSFSSDGNSLALVDTVRKAVSMLRDGNIIEIATDREGLNTPIAASFASGDRIVISDRESRIHVVSTDRSRAVSIACPCMPTAVELTSIADTFRISELASGALWIAQISDENTRAMFIPEDHTEAAQGAEDGK